MRNLRAPRHPIFLFISCGEVKGQPILSPKSYHTATHYCFSVLQGQGSPFVLACCKIPTWFWILWYRRGYSMIYTAQQSWVIQLQRAASYDRARGTEVHYVYMCFNWGTGTNLNLATFQPAKYILHLQSNPPPPPNTTTKATSTTEYYMLTVRHFEGDSGGLEENNIHWDVFVLWDILARKSLESTKLIFFHFFFQKKMGRVSILKH